MNDELSMCPFERTIEGLRGTVLLRRNHAHTDACVLALRRRPPPPWSTHETTYHVQESAA